MGRADHYDFNEEVRQRIGPAIRELRIRRKWSQRDLSHRAKLSSSYLSRLERGQCVPSFTVLTSLATAFNVSVTFFSEFQRTAEEFHDDLTDYLEEARVPQTTWGEFESLSLEARGALLDVLRRNRELQNDSVQSARVFESTILDKPITMIIDELRNEILKKGMSAVDYERNRTQLEEAPGRRFVISDRLSIMPAADLFDQVQYFRNTFGHDPQDWMLLKWWNRAQQTALHRTSEEYESQVIYPIDSIARYLETGQWGTHLWFSPDVVRKHVEATIYMLRNKQYRIGLIDAQSIPLRVFAKEHAGALIMAPTDTDWVTEEHPGVAVRFSALRTITQFREYFDEMWDSIPEECKDPEAIVQWLESHLLTFEQR